MSTKRGKRVKRKHSGHNNNYMDQFIRQTTGKAKIGGDG